MKPHEMMDRSRHPSSWNWKEVSGQFHAPGAPGAPPTKERAPVPQESSLGEP
jgi:hypothetical protein